MEQFAVPATARDGSRSCWRWHRVTPSYAATHHLRRCRRRASSAAPTRSASTRRRAGEALRPRQFYFVLPAPMLRRLLFGDDMAALAVRAATPLAVEVGLGTADGSMLSP
ncbi:unnamed protein product [Urochloa humidicola]